MYLWAEAGTPNEQRIKKAVSMALKAEALQCFILLSAPLIAKVARWVGSHDKASRAHPSIVLSRSSAYPGHAPMPHVALDRRVPYRVGLYGVSSINRSRWHMVKPGRRLELSSLIGMLLAFVQILYD